MSVFNKIKSSVFDRIGKFVILISLTLATITITAVSVFLDPILAVKGSYVLVGLSIAAVAYYNSQGQTATRTTSERQRQWAGKGILILFLLSVTYVLVTGSRTLILAVCVPLGYVLIGVQYINEQPAGKLVPQVALLFWLTPLTKFMSVGFYFRGGDLFFRTAEINGLLATKAVSGIASRYEFWPGLHIVSGFSSLVTGLSPHDALLSLGGLTYTGLIFAAYAIAALVTRDERLAIAITISVSLLGLLHRYAIFFYPQAFAMVIATFLLYVVLKRVDKGGLRTNLPMLVLVFSLIITHHLTLLFLVPVVVVMVAVAAVNREDAVMIGQFVRPFVILFVGMLSHWLFTGRAWFFFIQLRSATTDLVSAGTAIAGTSGNPTSFAFGMTKPTETFLSSLVHPSFLYFTLLTTFFMLGIVYVLRNSGEFRSSVSFIAAGIVGSVLIFNTPLSLKGITRASHAWYLPFAFITGTGIYYLAKSADGRWVMRAFMLLLALSGAAGPILTTSNADLFYETPQRQTAFDDGEQAQVEATARLYEKYGTEIDAPLIESQVVKKTGAQWPGPLVVNRSGIFYGPGLFMYRDGWVGHEVRYSTGPRFQGSMFISLPYLRQNVQQESRVYTSGQVGMVWSNNRTEFGPGNRSPN